MSTKLNQIIAVRQGVATTAQKTVTGIYRKLAAPTLYSGLTKSFTPKDEESEILPGERTLVQTNVPTLLGDLSEALTRLFDVTLTQESTNATATANVVVEGETVLEDVPVTYLLFLEKQLKDIGTFVRDLPVLDPSVKWTEDPNTGNYVSEPKQTNSTKKVAKVLELSPATDKFPAQVEKVFEDVTTGTWTKLDFSGAIPATRKKELVIRVEQLTSAVKFAREEANSVEVEDRTAADKVFGFLFA